MSPRRLLIVNADDYGLTEGVARAVLDAHRCGVVTSTSVLALGPAFERTVRWLDDAPDLGVGAHLAVVGEDPPLLSAREVPSLVDTRGHLHESWRTFLPAVALRRVDLDDVRRELGAQLERLTAAGLRLDHLDTHQNVHLWPPLAALVLELGERHGVRAVRVTRSAARSPVGAVVEVLGRRLARRCRTAGWAHPAASTGLDEAGTLDRQAMISAVYRLASTGAPTAELATHPGTPDDDARARYRWGYAWEAEWEALRSPEVRHAVRECGFELGTFADLARGGR